MDRASGGRSPGRMPRPVVTAARGTARLVLRTWLALDVHGGRHVPRDGGVLLAATHTSHADTLAIGAAVHRPLSFLGDVELTTAPVVGPLLEPFGMVPVDRGTADVGALDDLADRLRAGAALVVYPEGSRSRDGRVHRPRSGVSRLAAAARVPVVPVGVTGTATAWPVDGHPRPWRTPVSVRFGAPMSPPQDNPRARRGWNGDLHGRLARLAGRPAVDHLAPVGGGAT